MTVFLDLSAQPHQLPDKPIAHFDAAHQDKHIKNHLAYIVPHDGGRRQGIVRDGGRCGGKGREDHTGYDLRVHH